MCWSAELQEKTLDIHHWQVRNALLPLWNRSGGRLWGLGGQNSWCLPLYTWSNWVLRLMVLATLWWVAGEGIVARGSGLFAFNAITVIHSILRLSTTADGKLKEMLRCAKVPGRCSCSDDILIVWDQGRMVSVLCRTDLPDHIRWSSFYMTGVLYWHRYVDIAVLTNLWIISLIDALICIAGYVYPFISGH